MKEDRPDALEAVLKHAYHEILTDKDGLDYLENVQRCLDQYEVADKYFFVNVQEQLASRFSTNLEAYIKQQGLRKKLSESTVFKDLVRRAYVFRPFKGVRENPLVHRLLNILVGSCSKTLEGAVAWVEMSMEIAELGRDIFARIART